MPGALGHQRLVEAIEPLLGLFDGLEDKEPPISRFGERGYLVFPSFLTALHHHACRAG